MNTNLSKKYSFENFVFNKSNQDIYNSALNFLSDNNIAENTFGIFGASDSGKTHLAQAMGNYLQQALPDTRVIYVSMWDFIKQSMSSIRNANTDKMIDFYTDVDTLILDSIDILSAKEFSQERLLMIIDYVLRLDKKIIFTSNKPLIDIKQLDVRITNRLSKGMNLFL
jgi:chromosomal replication initiator protein